MIQDVVHVLRPKDLWRGCSFPVGVVVWKQPKLHPLVYWPNKMHISVHGSFDLCTSGICQNSMLAYT